MCMLRVCSGRNRSADPILHQPPAVPLTAATSQAISTPQPPRRNPPLPPNPPPIPNLIMSDDESPRKSFMKIPKAFSGKTEDWPKFKRNVKLYIKGNQTRLTTDNDKVLFVIALLQGGLPTQCSQNYLQQVYKKY